MTLQAKSFYVSFSIHALVFFCFFILSTKIASPIQTVLLDFSLVSDSGGAGNPRGSLLRPKGSATPAPGTPLPEKRVRTEISKPNPVPPKSPDLKKLVAKAPCLPKAPVPIRQIEKKPRPKPVVDKTATPDDTEAKPCEKASETAAQSLKEPASQTASEGTPAECLEEDSFAREGYGLPTGDEHAVKDTGLYGNGTAQGRYLSKYFGSIRDMIMMELRYPPIARKNGWSGGVKISFLVCEDGDVRDVRVIDSSGFGVLDRNAIDTVKHVAPFPVALTKTEVIMPITYRLE